MKASECRKKTEEELKQELMALRKEQFSLRMQKKMGQLPKTHLVKKARRDIALIKTILKEKGLMV